MKILYIASIRLPTEKAHGVQIIKTCEAFALEGVGITLCVPNFLFSLNKTNLFDFYKVKSIFAIKKVLSLRLIYLGPIGFFLETLLFFVGSLFTAGFWRSDYIFTRDEMLAWLCLFVGRKVIWETHTGSYNFFAKKASAGSFRVVTISQGLKDFYISKGIDANKIIVSRDAVDIVDFDLNITKDEARKLLNLPRDKKVVLYAGRLDGWKGVVTFLKASRGFGDNVVAVIVGGDENHVVDLRSNYPKVIFVGFKPYVDLPTYQKSADVLVLPNTAQNEVSRLYTSPLKVFTYMASKVPIVASDLPSIREVLDTDSAVFVKPDDSQALLEGIQSVLDGRVNADIIAEQAFTKVKNNTWENRVKVILKNLN
ncbi:MAG: glycosyltransferase family 4 protein [Patescibacteria group bacterium]